MTGCSPQFLLLSCLVGLFEKASSPVSGPWLGVATVVPVLRQYHMGTKADRRHVPVEQYNQTIISDCQIEVRLNFSVYPYTATKFV